MADHMIVLTIEAAGEVTPAPAPPAQADTDEAEPRDDEELNDG